MTDVGGFRDRVKDFLARELPAWWTGIGALSREEAAAFTHDWRERLVAEGFVAPGWPTAYGGGGLSTAEQIVLAEELAAAGVPSGWMNDGFSVRMVGNTILRWGTDEQKAHFLPRIVRGDDVWCQGYSEPDTGSDLASVRTRAVLEGDEWVIDGQKIWTSGAREANWIFLLCRTDPDGPSHRSLSFILCRLDQPGIEVRPLTTISGDAHFNEVYLTGARTAREHVVGEVGKGWTVAMSLLGLERGESAATQPLLFRVELDRLFALAREQGRSDDPVVRQRLAAAYTRVEVLRYLGMKTVSGVLAHRPPGPESSITKLLWSEHHQAVTELAVDILGADALVPTGKRPNNTYMADDRGAPNSSASWTTVLLTARAETIYVGTSEIQRNIIGEQLLGLPKEPRPR